MYIYTCIITYSYVYTCACIFICHTTYLRAIWSPRASEWQRSCQQEHKSTFDKQKTKNLASQGQTKGCPWL